MGRPVNMDDEVDPRYLCPVCCEVLKAPLLTDCGHRYVYPSDHFLSLFLPHTITRNVGLGSSRRPSTFVVFPATSFCEECLQEAVKRQQQCPVCRRKLSTSSCQPDHQLAQQIAGMCVECVACGQKVCVCVCGAHLCMAYSLPQHSAHCFTSTLTPHHVRRERCPLAVRAPPKCHTHNLSSELVQAVLVVS